MSDTKRTDEEEFYPHDSKNKVCYASFCRKLERELNAANQIAKKYEDRYFDSLERIKELEEANQMTRAAIKKWIGEAIFDSRNDDEEYKAIMQWQRAKENKR